MPEDRRSEYEVLILAPTGRDAELIARLLTREGLINSVCRSVEELGAAIRQGAGLAIVAEEALIGIRMEPIIAAIRDQPPWSDFPLVLLTAGEANETTQSFIRMLGSEANMSLLDRPLRVATLLSSVRSAVRARKRQYEGRDYLEERQRVNERVLRTQKMESLGVLAGGVAHDFNNLLTGIMGNATLAVELLPESCASMEPVLSDIVSASERAADLTRQLLAYAGKGRFVVAPVDLTKLVRETIHLVQSTVPGNVRIRLDLQDHLPFINADASQIQQVAMNLTINAAESIAADTIGEVVVSTRLQHFSQAAPPQDFAAGGIHPGEYVALEVIDNGSGMDEATRARIFDPFFTTKFTGRGLGLAAVQGIVNGHSGALKVTTAPGKGSRFEALFPAARDSTAEVLRPTMRPAERTRIGGKILVIDDEITVRRTAKFALERHGYEAVLAENGREGIEIFRALEGKIAAVLLDLTMPGMNGDQVLVSLQAIRPDVKVVLSSGYDQNEVVRRFAGRGLAGFLQKPYTVGALINRIADAAGDQPTGTESARSPETA
jgi:signal transduction histidine kinase/CheY-like chemotaxis protein